MGVDVWVIRVMGEVKRSGGIKTWSSIVMISLLSPCLHIYLISRGEGGRQEIRDSLYCYQSFIPQLLLPIH